MSQGNRKVQYLIASAVCLASVTTGVMLSWTTPALPKLHDNEAGIQVTREQLSWVAAIGSPGFMMGSLGSRFISDTFGRRATILVSALPAIVGTLLVVSTSNVWLLYLTRFLWGIGTGLIVTVSSIYLAEISDKEIRGSLTVSSRFMFNLGNFLVMAIGPFVTYYTLNYLMLVLPILFFIACWFIPETPYFRLKQGRVNEAKKILKKLRIFRNEKELEEELESMQKDVKKETLRSGSLKELITGRQYQKAVRICLAIKLTQMLSGSILIQHYLGLILKDAMIDMQMSTAFIIFGGVRFISGIVSSLLADRAGRRPLLILSYLGTGLALSVSAAYFFMQEVIKIDPQAIAPYSVIAFAGIVLSVILSTIGFNSLIYVIPAEMFPMNVKSVAMTALNVFGGLSNFAIIKLYQQLTQLFGTFGMFTMFAVVSFSGSVFSFFMVPETKGKSLREILVVLQGTAYDEAAENWSNDPVAITNVNPNAEAIELNRKEHKEC